jgi:uncharacterized protein YrrD
MVKGKNLLGMSVVGQADGRNLGTVHDLFFDHDTDELLAFVLAEKDLFGLIDAQIVPWREVRSISGDVILVESAASKSSCETSRTFAKWPAAKRFSRARKCYRRMAISSVRWPTW